MSVTNLYLIRHAESILAHHSHIRDIMTEDRLTPAGIRQAERLRDRLMTTGEIKADVLLASTFPRARETAEILAPAFELQPEPDDDLQEIRPGDNGGMYGDEYLEKHARPHPVRELFRAIAPGAENWGQFLLRVATTLHRIADKHDGKNVVLVTHGGVVDGSILCLTGLGTLTYPAFTLDTDNTSITHWERFEQDGLPRWRLVKYNDAVHLHYDISTPAL